MGVVNVEMNREGHGGSRSEIAELLSWLRWIVLCVLVISN